MTKNCHYTATYVLYVKSKPAQRLFGYQDTSPRREKKSKLFTGWLVVRTYSTHRYLKSRWPSAFANGLLSFWGGGLTNFGENHFLLGVVGAVKTRITFVVLLVFYFLFTMTNILFGRLADIVVRHFRLLLSRQWRIGYIVDSLILKKQQKAAPWIRHVVDS